MCLPNSSEKGVGFKVKSRLTVNRYRRMYGIAHYICDRYYSVIEFFLF